MDFTADVTTPKQSAAVQKMIQAVSLRLTDIMPIYKPLVRRLKQMVRAGVDDDGEILLDVLSRFLRHDLSAEAFQTFWASSETKAAQAPEQPKYNALAKRLQLSELIPFFGPEIQRLSTPPPLTTQELAQTLAQQAGYPNGDEPLAMISQYYQMTEHGRGLLLRAVQEALDANRTTPPPNPAYALLADISQPFLVISASYDSEFERLLLARKKKFAVIAHFQEDRAAGKILLKYGARAEPEEPLLAEELSKLRLLENGYSLIYKVCGCLGLRERIVGQTAQNRRILQQKDDLQQQWDLVHEKLSRLKYDRSLVTDTEEKFKLDKRIAEVSAERDQLEQQLKTIEATLLPQSGEPEQFGNSQSQAIDSVLISEDDYFGFAKHVEQAIPDYLSRQFARRSFLMLGHHLAEWHDRLLLNAILEKKRAAADRSYAVQERPTAYASAYWKAHGVDVYQVNLKDFVEKLGASLK